MTTATTGTPSSEPKTRLADDAYRLLKAQIIDNIMPPGYQALEPELAERLAMSRTPVRQALIRLQQEGLVELIPRRGMRVLPVSPNDMQEIYQILTALESEAAGLLAARRHSAEELRAIEQACQDMEQAIEENALERWAAADARFHRSLLELCGNRRLATIVATLYDQAHRARMITLHLRQVPLQSTQEQRMIYQLILQGDEVAVRDHYRRHRERATRELLDILQRHRLHQL